MTDEQHAVLRAMQAETDRLGREVARIRFSGGSAEAESAAMVALLASQRRGEEYLRGLGFRIVERGCGCR